jgi:hypothetical protein
MLNLRKYFVLLAVIFSSLVAFVAKASPTIDETIMRAQTALESGLNRYFAHQGFTLTGEAPVTIIPMDRSLGEFASKQPPFSSIPGVRLAYGKLIGDSYILESALSIGRFRLNEDPFQKVNHFRFDAKRVGFGVGISKWIHEGRVALALSQQWNTNHIRGGLIDPEFVSMLDTRSITRGVSLEGSFRGWLLGVSQSSRKAQADFRVFEEGTPIFVDQDGSLPLRSVLMGYQGSNFRIDVERTKLDSVDAFYQIAYYQTWFFEI